MAVTTMPTPEPQRDGIADVIGERVQLNPTSHGNLRGACPWCRSEAFNVRPAHGTFHCYGCGRGGDAAAFTAKLGRV